jgi:hypothetical protein
LWLSAVEYNALSALSAQRPALDAALLVLNPLPPSTRRAPVWEECAVLCWIVARDCLRAIDRPAGETAKSAAVRFASVACKRMGFEGATAGAIAKRLAKLKKSDGAIRIARRAGSQSHRG